MGIDGCTIDYTYAGGWRFRVTFKDGLVSYRFLGEGGGGNKGIPYKCRLLGPEKYHVVWHERDRGDVVSLVVDLGLGAVYSAAVLGYMKPEGPEVHFEDGVISEVVYPPFTFDGKGEEE